MTLRHNLFGGILAYRGAGHSARAALALASVLLTAPLAASPAKAAGAPVSKAAPTDDATAAWQGIAAVGRCEVRHAPRNAAAFLASQPGSPDEEVAYHALFGRDVACLGELTRLSAPRLAMRGTVAEAFLKAQPLQAVMAEANAEVAAKAPPTSFSECYVASHPRAVRALLTSTTIASAEEHAAIAKMSSDFGPCLSSNQKMRVNAPLLRLMFAEALYDLSHSQPGVIGASAAPSDQRH